MSKSIDEFINELAKQSACSIHLTNHAICSNTACNCSCWEILSNFFKRPIVLAPFQFGDRMVWARDFGEALQGDVS